MVQFCCVCLYRIENGGNKLLTNNPYNLISAIRSSSLSILVYWSFVEFLSTSESDPSWWRWLKAQTYPGTHIILLHIHSKYVDSILLDIFLRILLIQWSHIQVKFEELQSLSGTEHSSLLLINLTCKEPNDRVWRHDSFACDSRYRAHIFPSFLENLKNEDFNGPYLENENEFFKNFFETVFRASKSRDRGQLVSAFQLTFNDYELKYQAVRFWRRF